MLESYFIHLFRNFYFGNGFIILISFGRILQMKSFSNLIPENAFLGLQIPSLIILQIIPGFNRIDISLRLIRKLDLKKRQDRECFCCQGYSLEIGQLFPHPLSLVSWTTNPFLIVNFWNLFMVELVLRTNPR